MVDKDDPITNKWIIDTQNDGVLEKGDSFLNKAIFDIYSSNFWGILLNYYHRLSIAAKLPDSIIWRLNISK